MHRGLHYASQQFKHNIKININHGKFSRMANNNSGPHHASVQIHSSFTKRLRNLCTQDTFDQSTFSLICNLILQNLPFFSANHNASDTQTARTPPKNVPSAKTGGRRAHAEPRWLRMRSNVLNEWNFFLQIRLFHGCLAIFLLFALCGVKINWTSWNGMWLNRFFFFFGQMRALIEHDYYNW